MQQGEQGDPGGRSWRPSASHESTLSQLASGFGPLDNFSYNGPQPGVPMVADDHHYNPDLLHQSFQSQGSHHQNENINDNMNTDYSSLNISDQQQTVDAESAAQAWPAHRPAHPTSTYVEPPSLPTAHPVSPDGTTNSFSGDNGDAGTPSNEGDGHHHTTPPTPNPDQASAHAGPSHRCRASTTFSIDIDTPMRSVRASPNASTNPLDTAVNFYGVFQEKARLQTRELLQFIPLPLHRKPVDSSKIPHPLSPSATDSISLSRFLRQGSSHSTLLEFEEFVAGILQDDTLDADQRASAIEERAADIIEEWGRAYLCALITSARISGLEEDVSSLLKPFENSIEVTILLAIASQFDLRKQTKEKVLKGWRVAFDELRRTWYDACCVTPAMARIIEWFNRFLVTGCSLALSLCQTEKHMPDLAYCVSIGAWGEVHKIILELAASGGYLHHFRMGPAPAKGNGPKSWDMNTRALPGEVCLMLANHLGDPNNTAVVELFRHIILCAITAWLVNYLVTEKVEVAVEQYIEGTNPYIEYPEVKGNYVPPWTWVTAVSSAFISVVLGAVEEYGWLNVTPDSIVSDDTMMRLFTTKVQCARALFIDLWLDEKRYTARSHINWVSEYNLLKCRLAIGVDEARRSTSASALYVVWDPVSHNLGRDSVLEVRGRNPNYTKGFLESFHKLALSVNEDANGEKRLPFTQELANLFQMSYLVTETRTSERVKNEFAARMMDLSPRTAANVGTEVAGRMKLILAGAKERALQRKMDADILKAIDVRERAVDIKSLELRQKVAPANFIPRGIERPRRRVVTPPAIVMSQPLPPDSSTTPSSSQVAPSTSHNSQQFHFASLAAPKKQVSSSSCASTSKKILYRGLGLTPPGQLAPWRGTRGAAPSSSRRERETIYPGQGSFQVDTAPSSPPPPPIPPPSQFGMAQGSPLRAVIYAETATSPSASDLTPQERSEGPS